MPLWWLALATPFEGVREFAAWRRWYWLWPAHLVWQWCLWLVFVLCWRSLRMFLPYLSTIEVEISAHVFVGCKRYHSLATPCRLFFSTANFSSSSVFPASLQKSSISWIKSWILPLPSNESIRACYTREQMLHIALHYRIHDIHKATWNIKFTNTCQASFHCT